MSRFFYHDTGEPIKDGCPTCERIAGIVSLRIAGIVSLGRDWPESHKPEFVAKCLALSGYIESEHRKDGISGTRRSPVARHRPAKAPVSRPRSRSARLPN